MIDAWSPATGRQRPQRPPNPDAHRNAPCGQLRQIACTLAMMWCSLPAGVLAQTPDTPDTPAHNSPPSPADTAQGDNATEADVTNSAIDLTRRQARATMEWLAKGVDGWFGDIPFSQGGAVTDGEIGWNIFKRTDQDATQGFRFTARFKLPNLESKKYIFVGRDDRQDVITDRPDTFTRQQQLLRSGNTDNAFFAGVGAAFLDAIDMRLGIRGGLKPYAQARYKTSWALTERTNAEFRETLFYSVSDRLGSTTAFSFTHAQSPTLAYRWLNVATATQHSKDFAWSSVLGAYLIPAPKKQLALEMIWGGVIGSAVTVADYGLQTRWSQPLHHDQLIGELIVGHFWPRPTATEPRHRAWAIGTDIRIKF